MTWYTFALALGALFALVLSRNVQRAPLWIFLGASSFFLSYLWWQEGGQYPAIFGAITDFFVAGFILTHATKKWELAVVDCFGFMILVDLLWTVGMIPSHYLYATVLELANWSALLVIAMTGILERTTNRGVSAIGGLSWLTGSAYRYLHEDTRYPRWWRHP